MDEDVEALGEALDQRPGGVDRAAGAVDEQQVRPVTELLVVQIEIGETKRRHDHSLAWASTPTVYAVVDSEPST
ncbi:MAG: hypothetical protein QM733_15250 [Ilumatobacteraceae bacterium]